MGNQNTYLNPEAIAAEMRECGECTACCVILNVTQFAAPSGVPCRHLNGGCGIYNIRPQTPCRGFTCGWLEGHFDEEDRPDKSGAIVWGAKSDGKNMVVVSKLEGMEPPKRMLDHLKSATVPVRVQEFGEEIDAEQA